MVRVWLTAFLLLIAAGTSCAQDKPERLSIDDERLRTLVARLVPAVERACGRKFQKPPKVGLADAGDAMRALRDDLEPATAAFFAGQPRQRIEKALQLRADLFGLSVLGKYGIHSGEVYVLPHFVGTNLAAVGHGDADHEQVLQLVIAHELVHALQDQELGLGARLRRTVAQDAGEGLTMLIEGHAVFCSERAAAELGLEAAIAPLRAVFAASHDADVPPKVSLSDRRARGPNGLRYLRGARFLAEQHAQGGDDRLWQLLATPEPNTRLVLEGPNLPARRSLAAAFEGIDELLAGRNWTIGRGDLSGLLPRGENVAELADLEPLLAHWQAGGEWFATAPTPLAWRALYALSFADEAAAVGFCALAERVARATMPQDTAGAVTTIAIEGASTSRVTQELPPDTPVGNRVQVVWVRRGRHVLQFTCHNAPLDDAKFVAVATRVLTNLDE